MPKVALFVTCVADQVFPNTARATVRVLEAAGAEVVFPELQTCCGHAAKIDAIVTPSGSCAAMVCHHYPTLLGEYRDGGQRREAERLAARTFELTQYLVDELGVVDIGARLDPGTTVTVHDACHGLRNLGLGGQARALVQAAGGTLVEMTEADTCCGFGGVFSFGFPEVSTRLADAKLGHAATTSARFMVSGDLACLMHLEGRRRKVGPTTAPEPIHIADLLASGLPVRT